MSSSLIERHEKVYASTFQYDSDLEVVSADGCWVTDVEGERYLDFAAGISVVNSGHNNPAVVAAAQEQLSRLWHTGWTFRFASLVDAAEKVVGIMPASIDKLFFMNSGAEAVEAGVKLARKTTGRQGVMVFRGGFHGRTMGSVTYTTSNAKYRRGYHPLVPSVFVTPFPHPFRWGMTEEQATDHALMELELKLKHEVMPDEIAAFLMEPIQGEGGYYPAPARFMKRIKELCDEHGILLILDEVQTGFARTGKWFAIDHYGIEPDVLVVGKAIANGLPLSAVGARSSLLDAWPPGSHGTTFGGNPVACAAAAANVDVLSGLMPRVPELSKHSFARLAELKASHPNIGDVRGRGMMIGIELVTEGNTPDREAYGFLSKHTRENGLIILDCGPDWNVIRFVPPLCVTTEEIDKAVDILDGAFTAYEKR